MLDRTSTTLIALAAALLTLSATRPAHADPTADERDRAAAAHTRERNTTRARSGATSAFR